MMKESSRTKSALLTEISILKQQIQKLEKSEAKLKQAEKQRVSSKQILHDLVENTSFLIYAKDLDSKFIFVSQSLADFFGHPREFIIGKTSHDFLPKEIADQHRSNDLMVTERQSLLNIEETANTPDGLQYFISTKYPLYNEANEMYAICGISMDITDLKRTKEALLESEAFRQRIFESSQIPIVVMDADTFQYVDCNAAAAKIYGFSSREETLGKTPLDVSTQVQYNNTPSSEKARFYIEKALAEGMVVFEWRHQRPDGKIWDAETHLMSFQSGKRNFLQFTLQDMTEHKQAEEKLHQSEERYRTILEDIQEGYFEVDLAGNFTFFNDTLCRVSGYSREELMGMNYRQYSDHEECKRVYQAYHQIYTTGKPNTEFIWKIIRKDGVARYIEGSISLLKDLSGKPTGFRGIAHDITERQETEKVLQESEKRLRGITTNIPGVVFQFYAKVNGEYGISYVSERMTDLLEVPSDTGLDTLFPMFISRIHEEDLDRFTVSVQNSVKEIAPWNFEGRYIKPSGRALWFHAMSIPTRLEDRLVFDGILLDITERKQAEEALRESEELYTRLVNTIPDVVVRTDLGGKILFANDNALQMGGYRLKDVEGRNMIDFAPPEEHNRVVQMIASIMAEGKQGPHEYHLLTKDGMSIPYEIISDVFRSKDGTPCGYVHVCRDISRRKQDEEEKEHLQERLNQSQKMESVGRLAGGIAHDFNNMLGVILGHAELAMEKVEKIGPNQPLHTNLREIRKAAERSANLTRQLLAFARKQTVSPRVIDMNETVAGMLKMLQHLIGEDIHLAWLPGVNPWPVRIDPSQVDQILANLCVNARDAIVGVGKVTIESANLHFDEAFCTDHPDFSPGDYVLLAVSDDGCGMDKEIRDKLFEPFFTTKEIGKGTGLGLATVYGIVRQNNGFINIYSELGQGTTVRIYLPRHIGKAEQVKVEEQPVSVIRSHETILIVEDELAILDLSKIMLEKQGYRVLSAATPGEAIKLAEEHHGEIHLLITDVVMPEMNGRDLAKKILSLYPDMKRLFMSGYTADVIAHQGVLNEGVSFIQKPFSRNHLINKVREVLDQT